MYYSCVHVYQYISLLHTKMLNVGELTQRLQSFLHNSLQRITSFVKPHSRHLELKKRKKPGKHGQPILLNVSLFNLPLSLVCIVKAAVSLFKSLEALQLLAPVAKLRISMRFTIYLNINSRSRACHAMNRHRRRGQSLFSNFLKSVYSPRAGDFTKSIHSQWGADLS